MTTLTEIFPCFFVKCKANARVKPAKTGHGRHSSWLLCCSIYFLCCFMYCLFCDFPVLFVCICVLNNCHRVANQLQLNILYTQPAFLPSFMKTNKRTKKQMVERGVVLRQYEDNAINKFGKKKMSS